MSRAPGPRAGPFLGFAAGFDEAWSGRHDRVGNGYFLKGPDYLRYLWKDNRIMAGYPKWFAEREVEGIPGWVDAAVNGHGTGADYAYFFQDEGQDDWMSRNFFTGGIMPSEDLFHHFQDDLKLVRHWRVSGTHYQLTSEHWLQNLDKNRQKALEVMAETYGADQAARRVQMWRMFFLACAELFGYAEGEEWFVSHYLWERRG